jgi:hypothetical protein
MLPLERGGEFARSLEACREGAIALQCKRCARIHAACRCFEPELDIVVWAMRAPTSDAAFGTCAEGISTRRRRTMFISRWPRSRARWRNRAVRWSGGPAITSACLRACVMKPEHRAWLPEHTDPAARRVRFGVITLYLAQIEMQKIPQERIEVAEPDVNDEKRRVGALQARARRVPTSGSAVWEVG